MTLGQIDAKLASFIGGPTSGGLTIIEDTTVGAGGVASVTFSSIPQTYSHLYVVGSARSTYNNVNGSVLLQFNGDTGSNYWQSLVYYNASTVSAYNSMNTFGYVGFCTALTSAANAFSPFYAFIMDYTNTATYKSWQGGAVATGTQSGSTGAYPGWAGGSWQNTAAITSVTVLPSATGWAQYSRFTLYGLSGV